MIFYGIDPGFTGAIAVYAPNTGFFDVFDMPTMLNSKGKVELNHFAVLNILEKEMEVEHQAWIEKVGAMPGQGVSSMFRFGQVLDLWKWQLQRQAA
jgi:crossover junction endodeoxyribonuclease RuvC